MFGLRPTNLEVGYTASSALPAVLGKMVARWHKNRAVPKSACEKTDSGAKTELSHGEAAETGGWLRAIMLSDGETPGQRISQALKPGLTSMPRSSCGTTRFFVPGFASERELLGSPPTAMTCIASAGQIARDLSWMRRVSRSLATPVPPPDLPCSFPHLPLWLHAGACSAHFPVKCKCFPKCGANLGASG